MTFSTQNSPNRDTRTRSGMTLIELTVVILVMLSLIGIMFVGAASWKKGSDRANAILIIRSAQMGMRAHTGIEGVDPGPYPGLPQQVFGREKYVFSGNDPDSGNPLPDGELPLHPRKNLIFDFLEDDGNFVPEVGELYICTGGQTDLTDMAFNPGPKAYVGW